MFHFDSVPIFCFAKIETKPMYTIYNVNRHKADDRTRTDNLLITNQLLCQLSHIGIYPIQSYSVKSGTYRARTYDPLLVRQMLSQLS